MPWDFSVIETNPGNLIEATPERDTRAATPPFVVKDYWVEEDQTWNAYEMTFINQKEWRTAEVLSANCLASARGLSELGVYMA